MVEKRMFARTRMLGRMSVVYRRRGRSRRVGWSCVGWGSQDQHVRKELVKLAINKNTQTREQARTQIKKEFALLVC